MIVYLSFKFLYIQTLCFFLDPCNSAQCSFYSSCIRSSADTATCRCIPPTPVVSTNLRYTLCGSNGRFYNSKEEMQFESCKQQKEITVQEYNGCGKNSVHVKLALYKTVFTKMCEQ